MSGYTIVETMIFLVISGVILATSLLFFRGRQARIQFTQGAREIEAKVKTTMNEVASGYYPNKGDFSCTTGPEGPVISVGSAEQGSNESCVFLGKVMKFQQEGYDAYTVVGLRESGGSLSTSLQESLPTIEESIKESFNLPWGITITKVVSFDNGSISTKSSVGALQSLGEFDDSGAEEDVISGSQSVSLIPVGTGLNDSFETFENNVQAMKDSDRKPDKVYICLKSAGGDRQATIILGGQGKQLNSELIIDSNFEECEE